MITKSTNIYIQSIQHLFDRIRVARSTYEIEISALIRNLFLKGTPQSSRKNSARFCYNSKGNYIEGCYISMSENRFFFF